MSLTVLCRCTWMIHWGGCNNSGGGIYGQVTKCLLDDELVFYVRENLKRDHFTTSSSARIGMKRGESSGGREVLEVCCPADRWEEAAEAVRQLDGKGRPVVQNRLFNAAWAGRAFAAPSERPIQGR